MKKGYDLGKLWGQKGRIVFYDGQDYKLGYVGFIEEPISWGAELYPLSKIPVKKIIKDLEGIDIPPDIFLRLAREHEIK